MSDESDNAAGYYDQPLRDSITDMMRQHGISSLILANPDGTQAEMVLEVGAHAEPPITTEAIEAQLGQPREGIVEESDAASNRRCNHCGRIKSD